MQIGLMSEDVEVVMKMNPQTVIDKFLYVASVKFILVSHVKGNLTDNTEITE